jgi:hypothetical protein
LFTSHTSYFMIIDRGGGEWVWAEVWGGGGWVCGEVRGGGGWVWGEVCSGGALQAVT